MIYLKSTTKLKLVLDTNIIISALINRKSTIRDILLTDKITFYLPENLEKAGNIMEKIDIKDSEFVALALSIENDGIFSNDRHFDESGIKRWTVELLIEWLEK